MFRTEINVAKAPSSISLDDKIFLIGSCFADMVGEKLEFFKFNTLSNPFGNIYNPVSLFHLLENSLEEREEEDYTYIDNHDHWFNFNFHSEVNAPGKEELEFYVHTLKKRAREFLLETDVLILTLGTAFVYQLKDNNQVVANCHKLPQQLFEKNLLSPKEIIDAFDRFRKVLLKANPGVKIITTVSPVRHIKETLELNNVSKSVLRIAIHYIRQTYPEVLYFPAFEILLDDLRDYRFYKEDMIHPTGTAESYIWEKFAQAYFGPETIDFIRKWEKLSKALAHRPFQTASPGHQKFLKETLAKIEELNKIADFSSEIERVKSSLSTGN